MKIYIACGLTHVPREHFAEHAAFIHGLAASLQSQGHDVTYALVNSDPQLAERPYGERARLCYLWDRQLVEAADLVIAELSFPSTGAGIEMQIAEDEGTPILICYRNYGVNKVEPVTYKNPDLTEHQLQIGDGFVTLMAAGIPTVFRIIEYSESKDGLAQIDEALGLLERA